MLLHSLTSSCDRTGCEKKKKKSDVANRNLNGHWIRSTLIIEIFMMLVSQLGCINHRKIRFRVKGFTIPHYPNKEGQQAQPLCIDVTRQMRTEKTATTRQMRAINGKHLWWFNESPWQLISCRKLNKWQY